MKKTPTLSRHLRALAERARPGDRVPSVRQLMREFRLSQPVVQRLLAELKEKNLITAQVGRGTFFTNGDASTVDEVKGRPRSDQRARSVLLLHRVPNDRRRARMVFDDLQRALREDGHLTLEIAYSDPDHARRVLQGLPRFDACVVQNAFQEMPVEMLAAIRKKADAIVIDGTWLVGTDIDAVGFEWGEPLERAVEMLIAEGHERVGFVTTTHPFLANELGRQRYAHLQERGRFAGRLHPPILVSQSSWGEYEESVITSLRQQADASGRLPFSAVVVWGIESGAHFRHLLGKAGIRVPEELSVVLLGRTDVSTEHDGFFAVVGCSATEQAEALRAKIRERWAQPDAPHVPRLMPVRDRKGPSARPAVSQTKSAPRSTPT